MAGWAGRGKETNPEVRGDEGLAKPLINARLPRTNISRCWSFRQQKTYCKCNISLCFLPAGQQPAYFLQKEGYLFSSF